MRQLRNDGVIFESRKINSLSELYIEGADIILNCAGLGAREIVSDESVYPIRGQVLRVSAPWMTCNWNFGSYYIIPNGESVILGGTAQKNDWNTEISSIDSEDILKGVSDLFPALRKSPIIKHWAGLRPGRDSVQLSCEVETIIDSEENPKQIIVGHCYGHGGCGVTLGMGCAEDLVQNHLLKLINWIQNN